MKICINITANQPHVRSVLKMLASKTHEVIDDPTQAELLVTDSLAEALSFLKDSDEAHVLIALQPGNRREVEPGARSLQKVYAHRVHIRPILEQEGEENIVFFLTRNNSLET